MSRNTKPAAGGLSLHEQMSRNSDRAVRNNRIKTLASAPRSTKVTAFVMLHKHIWREEVGRGVRGGREGDRQKEEEMGEGD